MYMRFGPIEVAKALTYDRKAIGCGSIIRLLFNGGSLHRRRRRRGWAGRSAVLGRPDPQQRERTVRPMIPCKPRDQGPTIPTN